MWARGDRKSMTDIVGKPWGFCHTLRHDGIDYGDYIERLTYLLFLKMIEEKGVLGAVSKKRFCEERNSYGKKITNRIKREMCTL